MEEEAVVEAGSYLCGLELRSAEPPFGWQQPPATYSC